MARAARISNRPPAFVPPMAARLVDALPEGDDWLYEVKFDGYRALVLKDGNRIEIRSRHDKNPAASIPSIVAAGRRLAANRAVVDGEIVAVDAHGRPSFQALQHRSAHPRHAIVSYAFDLLHVDGRGLTQPPTDRTARATSRRGERVGHPAVDRPPGHFSQASLRSPVV